MATTSVSPTASRKAAWGWMLLNVVALAAAVAADFGGMQAAQEVRRTFRGLAFATQMWLLALAVAALWLGAFVAFRSAVASASRWAFGLMTLLTGLLLLGTFPPLMQPLWGFSLLRPVWRFELHVGPAHFAGLTLDLLFLLNLWGVLKARG
ncbi:MAG TPA: hypothetical protein ENJ54_04520 [Chloroflexi bacterium]|nr:hypothetical protein [Chloroflexota bacterium]